MRKVLPLFIKANMDSNSQFIPDGMNMIERLAKRFFDCIIALACIIVFSPLFLIIYLMVKSDHNGPAIYKQERIGLHGKPFYIYKFRSMKVDSEENEPLLLTEERKHLITRKGMFLRRHHLDELPQLWNVLKGDMAFVGPRPERKFYIDKIIKEDTRYPFLYQIRPGVTSYATLYNGYTDTMEKMLHRLELDLYYLEHRSWWFDIKIMVKTFINIMFGKIF